MSQRKFNSRCDAAYSELQCRGGCCFLPGFPLGEYVHVENKRTNKHPTDSQLLSSQVAANKQKRRHPPQSSLTSSEFPPWTRSHGEREKVCLLSSSLLRLIEHRFPRVFFLCVLIFTSLASVTGIEGVKNILRMFQVEYSHLWNFSVQVRERYSWVCSIVMRLTWTFGSNGVP